MLILTGNLKKENDSDAWVLWLGLQGVEAGGFPFSFQVAEGRLWERHCADGRVVYIFTVYIHG